MTDVLLTAEGKNGQLELTATVLRITRKGLFGLLTQGLKGDKEILISQISSIQFKNAGPFFNGYFQVGFLGGRENKGGIFDAINDENTVLFTTSQQSAFERVRDEVMARIAKRSAGDGAPASTAGEIERLAALRDKGLITDDEFQAAKRKALGI